MGFGMGRWMLLPAAAITVAAAPAETAQTAILRAMMDSAAGWSAGDLDRFMAVYAPDAVYVAAKGLVRGKAAIADRYRPSFVGGGNARGRLTFADMQFRRIDPTHELMWARWNLQPSDPAAKISSGWTTLLFERRTDGWRIISDHSS